MNFPELCETLINELGQANISSSAYPGLGAPSTRRAEWGIWVHDGIFDVGGEDRGEWSSTRQFATEDEACEYIYGLMTRKREPRIRTDEERARNRAISDAANIDIRERPRGATGTET